MKRTLLTAGALILAMSAAPHASDSLVPFGDTGARHAGDATDVVFMLDGGPTRGDALIKDERELAEFPPGQQITIFPDTPHTFSVALPSGPEIVDMMHACNAQVSGN